MARALTEALTEAAQAAARAVDWKRDQEAWNLPRAPREAISHEATQELDWEGFLAAYFPGSRRHNLKAIVAYADYKRALSS